jgi:hypothetical protein
MLAIGCLSAGPANEAAAQGLVYGADYPVGSNPVSVAIGDLNGDGRLDLAVANLYSSTVSVLLGTGGGGFGARTDFVTGTSPYSAAIGDLNGDGRPDLVAVNASSSTVSVLLGTGGGSFGAKTDFATGNNPHLVAIGDLSGDGKPDLAVTNYGAATVSVLLGTGGGSFAAKTDFGVGTTPHSVAIGDLNGDGRPDLAVTNLGVTSTTLSVLLGTGGGNFGPKTDFTTGTNPFSVVIGDLNRDGKPDLAVANYYSNTVSVLLGTGSGSFGAKTDFAAASNPVSVAIGDLNGDGSFDLAVLNAGSNSISVFLGNGAGSLAPRTDFGTPSDPFVVAIGDLNEDGRPDLGIACQTNNLVRVMLNNYSPPSQPRVFGPKTDYTTGNNPQVAAIGDLNVDGKPDLVVANSGNFSGSTVSVLLGAGGGSFGAKTDFATGSAPTAVAIGDLNADGIPDLAASCFNVPAVSVLLGTGGGSFGAKTDFATGNTPNFVAIGDLNADGKLDLVSANGNVSTVSVLLGTGTGSFGAKTDFATGGSPRCVVIADLNGDGKLDVATANNAGANVSVLLGTGTGSLGAKTDFATASNPIWVAIGDLNADGKPDLAAATAGAASVSVLLGTGGGSFGPKTDFAAGGSPQSVAIADLNADGKLDLAIACSGKVAVLNGNGAGSFAPRTEFPTGFGQNGVAIGDLNGDGLRDLVATTQGSNKVSVLLNTIDTTSPTAHLNAPNGGGTINTGSVTNITWTASDDYVVDHMDLYYSLDGGTNYTLIVANRPNSGSFGWSVPAIPSTAARVKVVAFDGSGHTAEDASDADFTIHDATGPLVHLDSPNGGETIGKGTDTKISWSASDVSGVDHVDLYYSLNGGTSYAPIASSQPNSGTYTWSVPAIATSHTVRVRVVAFDVYANSAADASDANFTIADAGIPSAHVESPNGGEVMGSGSAFKITWTASDNVAVAYVDLYYSVNGGFTYSPIAEGEANDGTYAWTIPGTATTQGRVRVVAFDGSGNSGEDASDADFTILDVTPPATPTPFAGVFLGGPAQLHWGANSEADFSVYHLYRGSSAGFVPGPGNLVVSQADTGYVDFGSTWSYYKLSALDASGNESGFAAVAPAGSSTGSTPPGSNVSVAPSPTVGLTFQNVTGGGQTQLTLQTGGSPPPGGLKLAPSAPPLYYMITTTATFTGTVTVCVNYDPEFITGQEKNLKLMHYDTAAQPPGWVQVTTSRDTAANLICGTITHFSEFALMETDETVAVDEEMPSAVQLYSCAPNPVSGPAQILYDLPVASAVRLGLFDLQGRWVRDLERQSMMGAGRHAVAWDGRGAHGEQLRAGVYFLWLEAGGTRQMRRVAVTR